MPSTSEMQRWLVRVLRWSAGFTGICQVLFFLMFFIGEGGFNFIAAPGLNRS
jgi:hypothetical protein